ncbi:histidine phosphatase family protein [Nocardioides limicola]|uniref:histidine phosphatase family protein n=1 Tax=Nocardioides limicola TaxID=2803368 RepID=UPI00193BD417|nr:histidine phosphatase family protein [Nocardioides sp. DJM-14]
MSTTTLLLVRHGVTPHTAQKRFSGGLGGRNPGLSDEGREQVHRTALWVAERFRPTVVVTSPVLRTAETAAIVAETLGIDPVVSEPGMAEMEFGVWEGLTFAEVSEQYADDMQAWFGSLDHGPGGGESLRQVEARVLAARDRLLAEHAGGTVLVVSHVTPIKTLVTHAVGAPLESVYRTELAPASLTEIAYHDDPERGLHPVLRLLNAGP